MSKKNENQASESFQETVNKLNEQAPLTKAIHRKGRTLVSGANFWPFEEENEFIGTPLGTAIIDPRPEANGKVLGYNFVDEQGEGWIIGASHAVTKALTEFQTVVDDKEVSILESGKRLSIQWLGKTILKKNNKPYNHYEVTLLDD
jgi:hypothetical protein